MSMQDMDAADLFNKNTQHQPTILALSLSLAHSST
jgi:hypothetical protein